jgi:hypothetical protein
MEQPVAVGARHVGVDLGDHMAGDLHGCARHIHRHTKRTETVAIWRRDLDQGDVERQNPAAEKPGHFAQKDRDIVGQPFVDCVADIGTDKEAVGAKAGCVIGGGVGGWAFGVQVDDFYIAQLLCPGRQGQDELRRGGNASVDKHAIVRFDGFDRFFCAGDLHGCSRFVQAAPGGRQVPVRGRRRPR